MHLHYIILYIKSNNLDSLTVERKTGNRGYPGSNPSFEKKFLRTFTSIASVVRLPHRNRKDHGSNPS